MKLTLTETDSFKALIEPALGEIPYVGKFLSGAWAGVEAQEANAMLESILANIEETLEKLENEVKALSLNVKMDQLYASTNQAQAQIESWYENDVKQWLQGNFTGLSMDGKYLSTEVGTVGNNINVSCAEYLDNINDAILGTGDFNSGKWLDFAIQQFLLTNGEGRLKQEASFVELSYRYFLKLINLQLQGVSCLRAINSEEVNNYTYRVLSNIITQGRACQKIVNNYKDNENFSWMGNNTALSSSYLTIETQDENRYFSEAAQNCQSGTTSAGVEFSAPAAGSNQWGLQISSATLNPNGQLSNINWAAVVPGGSDAYKTLVPPNWPGHYDAYMSFCNEDKVFATNEVLTGLTPSINQYGDNENFDWYINQVYAKIQTGLVQKDGSIAGGGTTYDQTSSNSQSVPRLNYVTLNEFSLYAPNSVTSPITGFGFCQVGNRLAVKVQTSIHLNAFSPIDIVAPSFNIHSGFGKGFLSFDFDNLSLEIKPNRLFDNTQEFILEADGVNNGQALKFGITGKLKGNNNGQDYYVVVDGSTLSLDTNAANATTVCIANPANLEGNYGNDGSPTITNWNTLVLGASSQYIEAQGTDNAYAPALGTPDTINNGDGITSIMESPYVWTMLPTS